MTCNELHSNYNFLKFFSEKMGGGSLPDDISVGELLQSRMQVRLRTKMSELDVVTTQKYMKYI